MSTSARKLRTTAGFAVSALLGMLVWPGCSSDKYSDADEADCMGGAVSTGGAKAMGGNRTQPKGGTSSSAGDRGLGGSIDAGGRGEEAGDGGESGAAPNAGGSAGRMNTGGKGGSSGPGGTAGRASTGGAGGNGGIAGSQGTAGKAAVCGNGVKESGEDCDDGNLREGDGCNVVCKDSRACEACVSAHCDNTIVPVPLATLRQRCFDDTTPAAAGPSKGTPRNQLCVKALQCIRNNRAGAVWAGDPALPSPSDSCVAEDAGYCGTASGPACDSQPSGPCVKEYEAAAEPANSEGISGWTQGARTSTTLPLGVASLIATRCEASACAEECNWLFSCVGAPANSGRGGAGGGGAANGGAANGGKNNGGTASGGGGAANGGAGNGGKNNGGTASGGGGAASGGSGGSGGASSGGGGTGGGAGTNSCATRYDCSTLTGSIGSTSRSVLCQNAAACMTREHCATSASATACYCNGLGLCGQVGLAPCVAEIDAAADATGNVTQQRMLDPTNPAGLAVQRATCEAP